MLAAITQTPEIALQDEQSAKLAEALANVTRHMNLPALSPEKLALGMLFWTAGTIYVPMGLAIAARKSGKAPPAYDPAAPLVAEPDLTTQFVNPAQPAGSWFMPAADQIN